MSQSKIQNSKFKIKNFVLPMLACALILTSCGGGGETESLTDLKAKQADLKTQLAEISTKISKLEGDSGKKFVLVEAAPVVPAIFKSYINVQGHVDAEENVSLAAEVPGTVTKIHVKVGDYVTKGQVLAETDARPLQQQLAAMQTSMALVNQTYDRQKSLWDQKIGTEMQYLSAKAMKEATESSLAAMNEQIRMTKITSPIDGTVDGVDIKLGQLTAPGTPAIRVVNFSSLKLKADLAESFASKVHKGDEVKIKFPDSDDTLSSTVYYSARSISVLNRTFGVEILLNNKKEYHPNQIAMISINDYKSLKPVISIPVSYVQKDLKGQSYVLVADGNKAAKRNVKVGKEYNGTAEVKEGLTEKDLLITSGFDGLNEGDAIQIKK